MANHNDIFLIYFPYCGRRDIILIIKASFKVKTQDRKTLPPWLVFDKKAGVFWGVPLSHDLGRLHLTVREKNNILPTEDIVINITEPTEDIEGIEKCQKDEDDTVLTLLVDKNIKAIKPRQRVIAIINFAKFFGLPYVSSSKAY